jgi:maltose O-acetyltransferase
VIIGKNSHTNHGCIIFSHDGIAKNRIRGANGLGKVVIGDNVFLGVRSIFLSNVTIYNYSAIGAGSVVTKDIPADVIAAGNPARVIKKIRRK